jgi:protein ImuB
MLWLCIGFPRLPFDALSLNDAELVAVTLTDKHTRRILVGSKFIERQGLTTGTHFVTAATLCVALKPIERNHRAERIALDRLAAWAYQWSSSVVLHLANQKSLTEWSCLWLEIEASFALFGGRAALLKQIEAGLVRLGYEYRLGMAYSLEAAALLARANRRVIADTDVALRRQLRALPIGLLSVPDTVCADLQRTGIRTIGTCIDLPRDALARRFGPQVNTYFDKLLGAAPDPRPLFQLPKKYRALCELGAEITDSEALLFPLRRMLSELQGYLRAIDGGVQRFTIHLKHRDGSTRIPIGLSAPERNADRFFALTRERFERVSLSKPVIALGLQADRFTPPVIRQDELFVGAKQVGEQLQELLDKLAARLGDDVVQGHKIVADHRPEKAWRTALPGDNSPVGAASTPRPLWLLSEPKRIAAPMTTGAPERIEGGWWDNDDARRDYHFVHAANGAGYWIYRDLGSNQWFLHGLCG